MKYKKCFTFAVVCHKQVSVTEILKMTKQLKLREIHFRLQKQIYKSYHKTKSHIN